MRFKLILVVATAFLLAADKPVKDPVKEDLTKLQGTWVGVQVDYEGLRVHPQLVQQANITLSITGDKYSFCSPKMNSQGKLQIDPTRKPKTIAPAPAKNKTLYIQGIYEVRGDTLWVCGGSQRPAGFKSYRGGPALIIFKKVKK